MSETKKYAELIVSMSTDYLSGKINEDHYKNMLNIIVKKLDKKQKIIIANVSKRFLFEGIDLTNNQPFKKVIDAEDRESAIADMEVTYPELKWVMTTEV